jgi:hypothetical protein
MKNPPGVLKQKHIGGFNYVKKNETKAEYVFLKFRQSFRSF